MGVLNTKNCNIRLLLPVICFFVFVTLSNGPSQAQDQASLAEFDTVCMREAPWNRTDGLDARAIGVKSADDWASPTIVSGHPAGGLAGIWAFELQGLSQGGDVATAGHLLFHQEGEGYKCDATIGCGYQPAQADAKWLVGGQRWGHVNYAPRTRANPEDIPPHYVDVAANGGFTLEQPRYYMFPEIKARFDSRTPGTFSGTWTLNWSGKTQTGKVLFTRIKPEIVGVKYVSTVTHEANVNDKGCVALDFDGSWWGAGNTMRGNRPGFNIEIYGKRFPAFASQFFKVWIDPETHLEVDSSSPRPIYVLDEKGASTGQLAGFSVHINIWPGSKWGPKVLHVEGLPITFDYYVKPQYAFQLDPVKLQLVHGYFPKTPAPGQLINIGFRLVNLPDHEARNAVLDLAFFDAGTFAPAKNIKALDTACTPTDENSVRCAFDAIAVAGHEEVEFKVPMPDKGLRWIASWKTEGGDPDGATQQGVIKADKSPQILHTFSISDQEGASRPQTTDYRYPYPSAGATAQQKREIIIFGKNLPQKFGDEEKITSLNPAISYIASYGSAYQSRRDLAWADLSKRFKTPIDSLKEAHQLLLLDATISGKVLPGEQSLTINGKFANWDLRFGGLKANLEFIREVHDQQSGEIKSEVLASAYVPERVRARITTSSVLPLDHVPLVLYLQRTNTNPEPMRTVRGEQMAATLNKITLTATSTTGNPTVYLSEPIRLVDKGNPRLSPPPRPGDIPIDIFTNGLGPDQLAIEVEPKFAAKSFLVPIRPASTALPISRTPAKHRSGRDPVQTSDYLFKSALAKAAQCHNIQVKDWGKLSLATSKDFQNRIVITHGDQKRVTRVRFAHHAAMLMMRDMLVEMLNEQLLKNGKILESELALKGYLKAMRLALDDDRIPINRIKVTAPDGSLVEFGGMPLYENVEFLSREYNSTPDKMARWRLNATAEAIARISGEASKAAEKARRIDACDIEGLLTLTGVGFGAVNTQLMPRLMRLSETRDDDGAMRLYWEPDLAARYWIHDVDRVARRLADQRQAASDDNARLTLLFSIVTMPIIAGATPVTAIILTGANLTLLGADTAGEWVKAYQSQIELDFSRDAAVVLGFARNDVAIKKAIKWHDAYNKTLLAVGLGTIDIFGVKEEIAVGLFRSQEIYLKGRLATRSLSNGGVRALSSADRRNLQLFAMRAKSREFAQGAEALDAVERRAIAAIEDDFRAAQTELIQSTQGSRMLGFGDELTLPPPLDAKTAIVRFEPVRLPTAGPGEIAAFGADGASIKMMRISDTFAGGSTPISHSGGAIIAPPPRTVLSTLDLPKTLTEKLARAGDDPAARARALADEVLEIPGVLNAKPVTIPLETPRGAGSFSAAVTPYEPFAEFPTLVKVNFGGHDAADVYGEAAFRSINGRFLLPRKVMSIDIPSNSPGYLRFFKNVSIVEDMGVSARVLYQQGGVSDLHRAAIRAALDDINDAGYVFLDFKWNNFSFVERKGRIKLGFFDFGGIVRVKGGDAALAREIQNIVVGPWDDVHRSLLDFGMVWPKSSTHPTLTPTNGRKALIIEKYGDQFEDLGKLGVPTIAKLPFLPSAGDTLDAATVELFTTARRAMPE